MATNDDPRNPPNGADKKPGLVARAGKGVLKLVLTALLGVAMLFGGFFVLVWGEAKVNIGPVIARADHLEDGEVRDGSPVTITGGLAFTTRATDALLSGDYGYVKRVVETCAWAEKDDTKGQKGQGERATYEKGWRAEVPDSSKFKDPSLKNQKGEHAVQTAVAEGLRVGEWELAVAPEVFRPDTIVPETAQVQGATKVDASWVYLGSDKDCNASGLTGPGAQRAQFQVLRAGDRVTAFGMKKGKRIEPFRGQLLLVRGDRDAMVDQMTASRQSKTWIFRAAGGLVLWIALWLIISPALKMVSWIPLFGGLIKGVATVVTLVAAAGGMIAFVFLGVGMRFFTSLFGSWIG